METIIKNKWKSFNSQSMKLRECFLDSICDSLNYKESRKNIIKILNYGLIELIEYISNQFDENNNLDTYGKQWRIAHKVSINELFYQNINDQNFLKYWSLENLYLQKRNQTSGLKQCNRCKLEKDIKNNFKLIKRRNKLTAHQYCNNCRKEYEKENNQKYDYKEKNKLRNSTEEYKRKRKIYRKNKKNNDPSFKLKINISNRISKFLRKSGSSKKDNSCLKYLGYSINQLKQHLESLFELWMSWDNYGYYDLNKWDDNDSSTWKWNLDHIIPHSEFKYTSMEDEEFKKCWALSNLRPLSAKQNNIDGINRTRHNKCE